jgi:hypothetical protein
MRRYSTFFVLLASIASARAVAAQATAAPQTVPVPIIGIGGGISIPAGGVAKNRQPGFNLDAMAEFRTPSEPLGLRGEVLYQYFGASKNSTSSDANAVAFLVNVVYHAPQSQVRPYLIGGMGLYHVTDNGNAAGFNVGTGLTIPFTPSMGAFAEARVHFALSQGPSFVTIPVTFGITF